MLHGFMEGCSTHQLDPPRLLVSYSMQVDLRALCWDSPRGPEELPGRGHGKANWAVEAATLWAVASVGIPQRGAPRLFEGNAGEVVAGPDLLERPQLGAVGVLRF